MLSYLIAGSALGLGAGLSPGPLLAFLAAQTARYGRQEGMKVALAPLVTDAPVVAAALLALRQLSDITAALALVSIFGGLYVIWLGIESVVVKPALTGTVSTSPRSFRRSAVINFLNPHVYVFWAAVGAPTTLAAWRTSPAAAVAFVAAFYVSLCGSKLALAELIHRSRGVLAGPRYQRTLRLLGLLLVCLGVWLLWEGARFVIRTGPHAAARRTAGLASPVQTPELVPPRSRQVEEHAHTIARHADLRAFDVVPPHRHLKDPVTEPPADEQRFSVETEAVDPLAAEDLARRAARVQLEAALCVPERQPDDGAHDQIEQTARPLAQHGLVDADERTIQSAGADDNLIVTVPRGGEQLIKLCDRR